MPFLLLVCAAMLTSALADETPVQTGPSGEILFYSETTGKGQLYVLNLSDGDIRQIGRSGSRPDHFPQWSPDGRKIVFESYRSGGWHPWVMNADGTAARRISDFPANNTQFYEFDPSFASDNQTILFINRFDLYRVTLSDRTPQRIGEATADLSESSPSYSPDMNRIVFDGYRAEDKSVHLYMTDAQGDNRQQLTDGEASNLSPVWSPDGQKVLFYSDRDGSMELYELEIATGNTRAVLDPAVMDQAGFTSAQPVDPWDNDNGATEQYRASYSPDGEWIAFSRDIDGDRELFAATIDGKRIERLTTRKGHDGFPAWRPEPQSARE